MKIKVLILFSLLSIVFCSCDLKSRTNSSVDVSNSDTVLNSNLCIYDSLAADLYDDSGKIRWGKVYSRIIRNKLKVKNQAQDTSLVNPDFSIFKKEKFVKSEYTKYQHFDLWSMKGFGVVDSTVFLYVRKRPNNIIIRISDNVEEPIILVKTANKWVLNYEYQINYNMLNRYNIYEYRNIYGILSDSVNTFLEEIYCTELSGEYYDSFWQVYRNEVQYISDIEFNESLNLGTGCLEFVDFLFKSPDKYFSEDIKLLTKVNTTTGVDECFIIDNSKNENHYNSLILGSGGFLQQRDLKTDHFLAKCGEITIDELP